MASKKSCERSLSTLVDESISENARLLFKRYQSPIQIDLNRPEPNGDHIVEDEIVQVGSSVGEGLRLRPVGGASNQVDGAGDEDEEDKIMNKEGKDKERKDEQEINVVKDREKILNSFAQYKAEKEEVEMNQEFFVNSIKELLTGELGYVSQSIFADSRKNQEEWKEYQQAPVLKKVFNHPWMTVNTVKESVIRNTQKYSIRFLWRWVPHRELQFLVILYFYSLLLLPEVLYNVVPTVLSVCIFFTMLVYSLQIISARLDFSEYLSIVDSLGFVDNLYKFVIASDYLKKTSVVYYIKFFFCWVLFLFVYPQVQTQIPSFFVPLSFIFFLASTYYALQVREKVVYVSIGIWFLEFLTWIIGMSIGSYRILLVLGAVTKFIHTIVFIYMAFSYKWKGFTLLLCPHFFMAVWWKMFALSVLNIGLSQLIYVIVSTLVVIAFMPFLTVLFVIVMALSPLAAWYYYDMNTALFVWAGLATAILGVIAFGWFYDKLVALDVVKLSFKHFLWFVFFLFCLVCFSSYGYSQYQFNQMSVIKWKDYSQFCSPQGGSQNFAITQHNCLHLVGRKVRLAGVIDNIYLESRDNSLERIISKIPFTPLVQGLTCLLGSKEFYKEDCDVKKYSDLCGVGHCAMSLGEEFTYIIELGGNARTFSHTAKISAGSKFKDELLGLKKWDKVNFLCRIDVVGATSSKIKLLAIQDVNQLEEASTTKMITTYLGSVVYFFLL